MGHLGKLAQMCARYCREFDDIIESARVNVHMLHADARRNAGERNLDYLNRGFKDLKRKFRENEMARLQQQQQQHQTFKRSNESESEGESPSPTKKVINLVSLVYILLFVKLL